MRYFLILCLLFACFASKAQSDSVYIPPYKRFPALPPLNLLLGDSATTYTKAMVPKKKPALIMIFNPECSHCQHESEAMVKHKEALKNVTIIMATMQPLWQMNQFVKDYHLDSLPGLVAGKDVNYTLLGFYDVHSLPYLAMYDKKGQLIESLEGSQNIEGIISKLKNGK